MYWYESEEKTKHKTEFFLFFFFNFEKNGSGGSVKRKIKKLWPNGCHYTNMPMQCTLQGFLNAVKMIIFRKKNDNFLIFAQNIDCGYMLEQPH